MPNRGYIWTIAAGWALAGFCFGHIHGAEIRTEGWWFWVALIATMIAGYTYHELSSKATRPR